MYLMFLKACFKMIPCKYILTNAFWKSEKLQFNNSPINSLMELQLNVLYLVTGYKEEGYA